jgi:hypothetical protein
MLNMRQSLGFLRCMYCALATSVITLICPRRQARQTAGRPATRTHQLIAVLQPVAHTKVAEQRPGLRGCRRAGRRRGQQQLHEHVLRRRVQRPHDLVRRQTLTARGW